MTTWLLKSEPDDYSYADLERDGHTIWDGVANPTACINIRKIKPGDSAFIYHTGKEKRIAGIAKVISKPYADPKREDLTAKGDIKFPVVDVEAVKAASKQITLKDIKADPRFAEFELVTMSRLSVMAVPAPLTKILKSLAGL